MTQAEVDYAMVWALVQLAAWEPVAERAAYCISSSADILERDQEKIGEILLKKLLVIKAAVGEVVRTAESDSQAGTDRIHPRSGYGRRRFKAVLARKLAVVHVAPSRS